jgi:hypothetical protein
MKCVPDIYLSSESGSFHMGMIMPPLGRVMHLIEFLARVFK